MAWSKYGRRLSLASQSLHCPSGLGFWLRGGLGFRAWGLGCTGLHGCFSNVGGKARIRITQGVIGGPCSELHEAKLEIFQILALLQDYEPPCVRGRASGTRTVDGIQGPHTS